MQLITPAEVDRLALGATLLGSGGGGAGDDLRPILLMLREVLAVHGPVRLLTPAEANPDDLGLRVGHVGSPLLLREKLPSEQEAETVLRAVESKTEQSVHAVIGWEMAGVNALVPLILAARTGLPVVDVDGMGRAFPRVDQTTYAVAGLPNTPLAITEPGGNRAVLESSGIEQLVRTVAVDFGGWAMMACGPLRLADAIRAGVPGAWARALELGDRWSPLPAERHWIDLAPVSQRSGASGGPRPRGPEEALRTVAERATASGGFLLARGKVIEVWRESPGGFPRGTVALQRLDDPDSFLRVEMQGEYLVVLIDGEPIATCPDIICCLDAETGRSIAAERISYGSVVDVVVLPTPSQWLEPEALHRVDPRAFGYDLDYVPLGRHRASPDSASTNRASTNRASTNRASTNRASTNSVVS